MIVRRFGATVGSVEPSFRAEAFNEITFARRPGFSMDWAEFEEHYERIGEERVTSESEGHVKFHAEEALLDLLEHKIAQVERALQPDEVIMVESQPGPDYPRTHEHTEMLVEDGHNRLHFYYTIDPPLRLGIFRQRA